MPSVSVIVPTYNTSKDGLARLVDSIDAQTLPPSRYEVVFVDDGSTDDTFDTLQEIARARPNVRALRIENSGWPSRPRNVGIETASGEYVLFMDHDDELSPDALRAGYELAAASGADVLNGKEAYTQTAHWALDTYPADSPQVLGHTDLHPLVPLNPHKLYRREFLLAHGIRFPEGRVVLWEDQFFNVEVARHARVIATLASVPFYHWVRTEGSGSTLFVRASEHYWTCFRRLLDWTVEQLSEPALREQLDQLMLHQYTIRILGVFDHLYAGRPEADRAFLFDQVRAIQEDYGLRRLDGQLSVSRRLRAELLAAGDRAALEQLTVTDRDIIGEGQATSIAWRDGVLHIEATMEWTAPDGGPLALEQVGDRVLKRVPDGVARALDGLPGGSRDVTAEIAAAELDLSVRSRPSRMVWLTPTDHTVSAEAAADGGVRVTATLTGRIDPETAALGNGLDPVYQDVLLRCRLGGSLNHRALRSTLPATVTVRRGRLHLVYPNDGGAATLIPDGQVEALRRLRPESARRVAPGRYEIALAGEHDGSGQVATTLGVSAMTTRGPAYADVPATLRVEDGRASVRFAWPEPRMIVRIGDRAPGRPSGWAVETAADGAASVTPLGGDGERPRTRVLLITNRDSDNVGDQLIEESALSLLRKVLADLGVAAGDYTITSRAAGMIPKRYAETGDPALLAEARRAIGAADVVVFGGAPLFNYAYQEFSARTAGALAVARELDVPVIFSSIGIEGFDPAHPRARALQEAVAAADVRQITTRDDLDSLRRLVAGTRIPIARVADPVVLADAVFAGLPAPRRAEGAPRRIGLVVTRTGLFADNGVRFSEAEQRRFWMDVIAEVEARGDDYRLFTTGHFSDEAFLDGLVRAEGIPTGKVAFAVNSPEELLAEIRACDGVIAFRLHASIAAYAFGIPSVGLSWNPKVRAFYSSIGLPDRSLEPAHWSAARAVAALEKAMSEGVTKDEDYVRSVYDSLFSAMKSVVAPDSERVPVSSAALRDELPRFAGTTPGQYRDKLRSKFRRTYESYRKYYRHPAAIAGAAPPGPTLLRRIARRLRRMLGARP